MPGSPAENQPFAGLPETPDPPTSAAPPSPSRPCWKYTIPKSLLSKQWTRPEADATFLMIEMTPDEQDRAVRAAGGASEKNSTAASHQMLVRSVFRVGKIQIFKKEDEINEWIRNIGPKGYRALQAAWVDLHSVEDRDLDTFLETAEYVD